MAIIAKVIYCKTCRNCKGHGPYLYETWWDGKKTRWTYLGKASDLEIGGKKISTRCKVCGLPLLKASRSGWVHFWGGKIGGTYVQVCETCNLKISVEPPVEKCPFCGGAMRIDHRAHPESDRGGAGKGGDARSSLN